MTSQKDRMTRRRFLKTSTQVTAMAGLSVATQAYGAGNDRIRVGLVGCGGRGTGAARDALMAGPNIELVAMGDIFKAKVDNSLTRLTRILRDEPAKKNSIKVKPDHCFAGLDAYKKVIDSDIDYVLLCTPPGFRPDHIEYAVKKGVHIFAEKPCATDAPGVRRILALENEMKRKGIGLLAGFNSRHVFHYADMVKAIHNGQLGDVMSLYAYFNTGNIWYREREPGMSLPEYHFHNWFHVDWLCGDHIVEQHVHNLDFCNWIMQGHPVRAYGMGGRQYHTDRGGNIYDHFTIEYEYGRESAYAGKNITWDQILNSDLQLTPPDIAAWDGTIRPVPKPGMPRV